jgi:TM2 domain-containing membrane protein YozV
LLSQIEEVDENYFSPKNRLAFGNYLFNEKDYLRAIEEFKSYLMHYDNDTIRFKFAESFFRIRRYKEASDNFKSIFYGSSLSDEAKLAFYKASFYDGNYNLFRDLCKIESYRSEKYAKEINRLYFISHLIDDSILPDTNRFFNAFPDSSKNKIRDLYLLKKFPVRKNPATAMLLSMFIPGAGKIYTGEIGDGITSFLTTGILTYLAVNNFKHEHNFRGWLFSGLAAFSYAGTIYGSYASAQIYNAGVKFNFDADVKMYFEKRNHFLPNINFFD